MKTQQLSTVSILAHFTFPAILVFCSYHLLFPFYVSIDLSLVLSYMLALVLPLVFLLIYVVVKWQQDDTTKKFGKFFFVSSLDNKDWRYILIGLLLLIISSILFVTLNSIVEPYLGISYARTLEFDANLALQNNLSIWNVTVVIIGLTINIFAEELYFRGYLLPRMTNYEQVTGTMNILLSIIPHSFLWLFFHIYKWSGLIALFPSVIIIPFIWMKSKNTSVVIIIHYLSNIGSIFILLLSQLLV